MTTDLSLSIDSEDLPLPNPNTIKRIILLVSKLAKIFSKVEKEPIYFLKI